MRKHRLSSSIKSISKKYRFIKNSKAISLEISKTRDNVKRWLSYYYFAIVYLLIIAAFLKLSIMVASNEPDYEYIISFGERCTILIATLSVLTFTYAAVLEDPKKDVTIQTGKYFFRAVLNFVIGIIFLIGFRDVLTNQSNMFGLPDSVYKFTIVMTIVLFFSGFVMLILSAYYLAFGITRLMKSLR